MRRLPGTYPGGVRVSLGIAPPIMAAIEKTQEDVQCHGHGLRLQNLSGFVKR